MLILAFAGTTQNSPLTRFCSLPSITVVTFPPRSCTRRKPCSWNSGMSWSPRIVHWRTDARTILGLPQLEHGTARAQKTWKDAWRLAAGLPPTHGRYFFIYD